MKDLHGEMRCWSNSIRRGASSQFDDLIKGNRATRAGVLFEKSRENDLERKEEQEAKRVIPGRSSSESV